jgi:hypothetical protein
MLFPPAQNEGLDTSWCLARRRFHLDGQCGSRASGLGPAAGATGIRKVVRQPGLNTVATDVLARTHRCGKT